MVLVSTLVVLALTIPGPVMWCSAEAHYNFVIAEEVYKENIDLK